MKRSHKDISKTKKEWKKSITFRDNDRETGRYRKSHGLGCNKTRCQMCKSHKVPKRMKTYKELNSEVEFKERIDEFNNLD